LYSARPVDPVSLAIAAGADLICPYWPTATPDVVAAAHAAGIGVSVWTANGVEEIQSAIAAGVDAITTDYLDRARASALPDR
jgi:glycerophosphoryl diester phosphodiesterase